MSAGIVYVNDLNRGGLCFTTIGVNPIMASLCRVEGGQMAGTAFIFINMVLYLGSFLVCLKMWRHEAARRERELCLNEPNEIPNTMSLVPQKPKRISFKDQTDKDLGKSVSCPDSDRPAVEPIINKITTSKTRVQVIADYIMKYPEITSVEQREEYKAVFNDQYQEYRDLHRDISLTLSKFRQLDTLMEKLLRDSTQNPQRIKKILQKLEEKKNDPSFLEKKERYDYLKAKLSHLKNRIYTFDQKQMNVTGVICSMYDPHQYDSPPLYSPKYSITPSLYPPRSVHSPPGRYVDYRYSLPDGYYTEERPQHFYRWFSPPGAVKTFQGATVLMCFLIFACVASTLVWDVSGLGYGGYVSGGGVAGSGPGYYGGAYGYGGSYMTPHAAKAAMISIAAVNFLVSLGFLVGSFSRSRAMRSCRFYLSVFICDIILAVLQSVALVLGMMVVLALSLAAYYSYKTRSKIWRHGKSNILWDEPNRRRADSPDLQDWVDHQTRDSRSTQQAPTLVISETAAAPDLRLENCPVSYGKRSVSHSNRSVSPGNPTGSVQNDRNYNCNSVTADSSGRRSAQKSAPQCSSGSDLTHSTGKRTTDTIPPGAPLPTLPPRPAVTEDPLESQCEMGYTTGGDTGNELDQDLSQHLLGQYPAIISDEQRREYKREFDSDLSRYKRLCADMDDISDQMHKLSRELDTLEPSSVKYQGVADEYNRLKDLKRTADYQTKKKQCRELRQKLFHIKRLVKNYDQGMC
ncbi:hypothetical protein WMY93_000994 [Mugilogobius chulae]|uniref:OCEL domain-containing protein n=1 Tax=Mugilogobius chulae TaxID=88201 RepID=A0AAW0Q2F0_9GOBI